MPKTERHPTHPPLKEGRVYLCIGPNCWAKAFRPEQAEANAKQERPRAGEWAFLMFDAPPDATVDGMGSIVWRPALYAGHESDAGTHSLQYAARELYRFNTKEPGK